MRWVRNWVWSVGFASVVLAACSGGGEPEGDAGSIGDTGTSSGDGGGGLEDAGANDGGTPGTDGGGGAASATLVVTIDGVEREFVANVPGSVRTTEDGTKVVVAGGHDVGGGAASVLTISVPRNPGALSCRDIGVLWSLSDPSDASAFQAGVTRPSDTNCEAMTTSAAGATTVTGTFSGTMMGISGPRNGMPLMLENGRYTINLP